MEGVERRKPESTDLESNDIYQMAKLHSLMEELKANQLSLKSDMEKNISELRRSFDSLRDLLMEQLATTRQDDTSENCMKHNEDKGVEVINVSTNSSCSLTRRATKKMSNSVATARKKEKVAVKSPVRVRSPILTRRGSERRYPNKYSTGERIENVESTAEMCGTPQKMGNFTTYQL